MSINVACSVKIMRAMNDIVIASSVVGRGRYGVSSMVLEELRVRGAAFSEHNSFVSFFGAC